MWGCGISSKLCHFSYLWCPVINIQSKPAVWRRLYTPVHNISASLKHILMACKTSLARPLNLAPQLGAKVPCLILCPGPPSIHSEAYERQTGSWCRTEFIQLMLAAENLWAKQPPGKFKSNCQPSTPSPMLLNRLVAGSGSGRVSSLTQ